MGLPRRQLPQKYFQLSREFRVYVHAPFTRYTSLRYAVKIYSSALLGDSVCETVSDVTYGINKQTR